MGGGGGSAATDARQWRRLRVSAERRASVLADIGAGSAPRPIYYVLLGVSALIAGFGLLANSPAVVIGAMLVSPLMTPIFGITVGLAGAHLRLLRDALIAEFGGVFLVVALGYLLGLLPLSLSPTPEMLGRTSPNLLDLFVAALAGLAGCLAMIDERISPSLPGVAIATSLTPPLATSGLCLAFGSYAGAWGAFLLFFANFLAILSVATTIFVLCGFVSRQEIGSTGGLLRRYAPAVIGLLAVTVLLTWQLLDVVRDRRTAAAIRTVLKTQLRDEPNTTITEIFHDYTGEGRLEVLSVVRASRVISPHKVEEMEQALRGQLGPNVDLFIRCAITKDVAARGTASLLAQRTLDGRFTELELSPTALVARIAEQAVRDILVDRPNFLLDDVNVLRLPTGLVVVVSLQGSRDPVPSEITLAEKMIRERTGHPELRLLVRTTESSDVTSKGRVLFGQSHFGVWSQEDTAAAARVEQTVRRHIAALRDLIAVSVDAIPVGEGWKVRADVVGPTIPSPGEIAALEKAVSAEVKQPVTLTLMARAEVVVTGKRYESVQERIERQLAAAASGSSEVPADAAAGVPER